MSDIPTDLKYATSHEWIRVEGDTAVVGISDHAQQELTDLAFIELPEVGAALSMGAPSVACHLSFVRVAIFSWHGASPLRVP